MGLTAIFAKKLKSQVLFPFQNSIHGKIWFCWKQEKREKMIFWQKTVAKHMVLELMAKSITDCMNFSNSLFKLNIDLLNGHKEKVFDN